jgi:hypothetical protein
MYEKHCLSRGWAPKSDNMGRYPRLCDYPRRKTDDIFWEDDVEMSDVCSWWSFRQIWKECCPHIRIQRPCNDTCGECTVYRNAFRYRESRKKAEVESDSDDSGSDDDEDQNKQGFKDDEIVGDLAKSFLSGYCLEQERILEEAGYHVKQSKGMRGYVQQQTAARIECRTSEVPHQDREYVIVCD